MNESQAIQESPMAGDRMSFGPLVSHARRLLSLPDSSGALDTAFFDRALRLAGLVDELSVQPELSGVRWNSRATQAAALFCEYGRACAARESRIPFEALLLAPYDEGTREACVDALMAAPLSAADGDDTRESAARALREWNRPATTSIEAQVLTEAIHLDDLGPLWAWWQARAAASAGASARQCLDLWRSRSAYGYWTRRIEDGLRFEWSRRLARRRIAAIQVFLEALSDQIEPAGVRYADNVRG
ncbi:MAG: hypothetical protein HUU22_09820 [Phycisphaerae bacterium]|nr:hypothetical protein [Phycisphaerae bacterium]NUQ46318.1 hypothetical protein [Phycisphaerae bacterium]